MNFLYWHTILFLFLFFFFFIFVKCFVLNNYLLLLRSPASPRWPIAMGWRPSSSVVRHPLFISFSQELMDQFRPMLVCTICTVRRQEIVNLMAPHIDQTHWGYSNDDQGRVYKNCIFNDPRGRGSCAGAFPYSANAIFLFFLLSTLGHGLDKLSTYDHGRVGQNL